MQKVVNQHGDVLFMAVDSIPVTARKVKISNGFVIERGEGVHVHTFPDVEGIEVFEDGDKTYVRVSSPVKIDHEEHGPQTVQPGTYVKGIERVFDYETMEARKVED